MAKQKDGAKRKPRQRTPEEIKRSVVEASRALPLTDTEAVLLEKVYDQIAEWDAEERAK